MLPCASNMFLSYIGLCRLLIIAALLFINSLTKQHLDLNIFLFLFSFFKKPSLIGKCPYDDHSLFKKVGQILHADD